MRQMKTLFCWIIKAETFNDKENKTFATFYYETENKRRKITAGLEKSLMSVFKEITKEASVDRNN